MNVLSPTSTAPWWQQNGAIRQSYDRGDAVERNAYRRLPIGGPMMNVARLAAYSALLADTLVAVRGRESLATSPLVAITLTAGAVAAVLVVNPGLDGEVVLSSYSDPATMVMVGALGLLGVELLARLAGRSA